MIRGLRGRRAEGAQRVEGHWQRNDERGGAAETSPSDSVVRARTRVENCTVPRNPNAARQLGEAGRVPPAEAMRPGRFYERGPWTAPQKPSPSVNVYSVVESMLSSTDCKTWNSGSSHKRSEMR